MGLLVASFNHSSQRRKTWDRKDSVFHTIRQDVSRLLLQKSDRRQHLRQVFKNLTVRGSVIPCMKEDGMPFSPKQQKDALLVQCLQALHCCLEPAKLSLQSSCNI